MLFVSFFFLFFFLEMGGGIIRRSDLRIHIAYFLERDLTT